jgi:hypothetical protein
LIENLAEVLNLYNSTNKLKCNAVSNSFARSSTSPIREQQNLAAVSQQQVLLSDSWVNSHCRRDHFVHKPPHKEETKARGKCLVIADIP